MLFQRFLKEIYLNRCSDEELIFNISTGRIINYDISNIDWELYKTKLSTEQLSVFRSFSRIAFYLPSKPFHDLIVGFQWDIEEKLLKDEIEFLKYSRYVSASTMTVLLFVMWRKGGDWPNNFESIGNNLIESGHGFGLVSLPEVTKWRNV